MLRRIILGEAAPGGADGERRILVLGAGAVGGYFGGRLAEASRMLLFLCGCRALGRSPNVASRFPARLRFPCFVGGRGRMRSRRLGKMVIAAVRFHVLFSMAMWLPVMSVEVVMLL